MSNLDKRAKILLFTCLLLVISLGITSGMIIKSYFLNTPQTTNQTINQSTNQGMNQSMSSGQIGTNGTSSTSKKVQNTSTKYVTTVCKKCGKKFTQPADGPMYNYCDKCLNDPEIQEKIENGTA